MVDEGAGQVEVSVAVLSGGLSEEVFVRVNTQDNTAQGKP